MEVIAAEDAKEWLCEKGYKPEFGAREMARVFQVYIKRVLADLMLFGDLRDGGHIVLSTEEITKSMYAAYEKGLKEGTLTPSIDLTGFKVGDKKLSFEVHDNTVSLRKSSGDDKNPKLEKDPA